MGPRRPIIFELDGQPGVFAPVGYDITTGTCSPAGGLPFQGDGDGKCNSLNDEDDFDDWDETDVIGGNKFIASSVEYRFPISETIGLQGILFFDFGNAFAEGDNLFDVTEWRYGTGAGVQWFSPFGPLMVVLGFPINPLPIEDSPVFEFSVGGGGF